MKKILFFCLYTSFLVSQVWAATIVNPPATTTTSSGTIGASTSTSSGSFSSGPAVSRSPAGETFNQSTITTGSGATDKSITSNIQIQIRNLPSLNSAAVTVYTQDGKVTLTGNVQTQAQADAAVNAARKVAGVKIVTNDITVRGGPSATMHNSATIPTPGAVVPIQKNTVFTPAPSPSTTTTTTPTTSAPSY